VAAHEQPPGDLRVGQALRQQRQHLHLARGQPERYCQVKSGRVTRRRLAA
jgi:hypothetical protein